MTNPPSPTIAGTSVTYTIPLGGTTTAVLRVVVGTPPLGDRVTLFARHDGHIEPVSMGVEEILGYVEDARRRLREGGVA